MKIIVSSLIGIGSVNGANPSRHRYVAVSGRAVTEGIDNYTSATVNVLVEADEAARIVIGQELDVWVAQVPTATATPAAAPASPEQVF